MVATARQDRRRARRLRHTAQSHTLCTSGYTPATIGAPFYLPPHAPQNAERTPLSPPPTALIDHRTRRAPRRRALDHAHSAPRTALGRVCRASVRPYTYNPSCPFVVLCLLLLALCLLRASPLTGERRRGGGPSFLVSLCCPESWVTFADVSAFTVSNRA